MVVVTSRWPPNLRLVLRGMKGDGSFGDKQKAPFRVEENDGHQAWKRWWELTEKWEESTNGLVNDRRSEA